MMTIVIKIIMIMMVIINSSLEQHMPLPEITEIINAARNLLEKGDLSRAFEYAQGIFYYLYVDSVTYAFGWSAFL
jgi:hypothetical protein